MGRRRRPVEMAPSPSASRVARRARTFNRNTEEQNRWQSAARSCLRSEPRAHGPLDQRSEPGTHGPLVIRSVLLLEVGAARPTLGTDGAPSAVISKGRLWRPCRSPAEPSLASTSSVRGPLLSPPRQRAAASSKPRPASEPPGCGSQAHPELAKPSPFGACTPLSSLQAR